MRKFMVLLCAVSLAICMAANANAALVVDTGPPANKWGTCYVGGGQTSQWLAGQFTITQGHDIYAMQGYLSVNVADYVLATIYNDNQGLPGTALFSKTFMSQSANFYGWQGTSGYAGHLDEGTYWIAFSEAPGSLFQGGMGASDLTSPVMAAEALNYNRTGWWLVPQDSGLGVYARIYDNPVPLPGALWLLGSGLAGLAAARRRLKK